MLANGEKRIAICFSGQIRTWRKCVDSWHNILLHNGKSNNIDVFCHMWDFNSVPNAVPDAAIFPDNIVPTSEIEELLDVLKPKKFVVESKREFPIFNESQAITYQPFISQFYGITQSARLKKQYEIENNIMYDVVVRSRYDSLYKTTLSDSYNSIVENTMEAFHFGWDPKTNRGRVGDICWMSDSQTYDIIADYYLNLGNIKRSWFANNNQNFAPELVFFHYIKKSGIAIKNNSWHIQLFRESPDKAYSKDKNGYETW